MEIGLLHHWFWTPMGLDLTVPTQNTPWDFLLLLLFWGIWGNVKNSHIKDRAKEI